MRNTRSGHCEKTNTFNYEFRYSPIMQDIRRQIEYSWVPFKRICTFGGLDVLGSQQEIDNNAVCIIDYANGVRASINYTYFTDQPKHNQFGLVGDQGKIMRIQMRPDDTSCTTGSSKTVRNSWPIPPEQKQIGRIEPPDEPAIPPTFTKVEEASRFTKEVDVDLLAVSVDTTHGVFKRQSTIDYELPGKLREAVSVPLVQHGTGGISLEDLSRLARSGMAKIIFGEPFRYNYIRYFYELTDSMEHLWHTWKIMREVKERLKKDMMQIIEALGSAGKAT
jgi:hypothetical protein